MALTLAEQQAKAARQGTPGYDVLGDPIVNTASGAPATETPSSLGLALLAPNSALLPSEVAAKAESDRQAALATPETPEERRLRVTNQFQGEIDALNKVYATQKQEAINRGLGNLGNNALLQGSRGLQGSSFGQAMTQHTNTLNAQDMAQVDAAYSNAVAGIYSKINSEISQQAKDKEAAMQTSAKTLIDYNKGREARAAKASQDYIQNMVSSGKPFTEADLNGVADQLKTLGIDPTVFKREYVTALETKKKALETEIQAKTKLQQEADKAAADLSKPFAVGDNTFQYVNGQYVNKGTNKVATVNTGDMTPRQNIVFNSLMAKSNAISDAATTFNVAKATATRLKQDPENAQAQLSNLYQYVKTLDSNSAVREGETQLAKDTGSLLNKLQSAAQSIDNGSIVGSDLAVKMADEAIRLSDAWLLESNKKQNRLRAQAAQNKIEQQFVDTINYGEELNSSLSNGGVLMSPDGTQQVDVTELTPEQIKEAKDAGWQ